MTVRWLILIAYSALIAVLSLSPSRTFEGIPSFSYEDLLVHFVIYAIYAALLLWAWRPNLQQHPLMPLAVIIVCASYGILMEILQPIVQPGDRTFAVSDIIANTTGATTAALWFLRHEHRRQSSQ